MRRPAKMKSPLIVITGGPGAGKTAVLEYIRLTLCEHVVIFPEAASILFGGGFWRLPSTPARKAAQRAIYFVQNEMQNLVQGEKKWNMGLCDRGTLDGLAYWPGRERDYFTSLETTKIKEYAKYKAVLHLSSPSLAQGYNYQNPVRNESPELAAEIDEKIHKVWRDHPGYFRILNHDQFSKKLEIASSKIKSLIPPCRLDHSP